MNKIMTVELRVVVQCVYVLVYFAHQQFPRSVEIVADSEESPGNK